MRGLEHLHKDVRAKAELFVSRCLEAGLKVKIADTLRTKAEQDALYAQGRTAPGNIVTKVQYPSSMHNWGVAFDIIRDDGTGIYNEAGGWFEKVGEIGESLGFTWGGRWASFPDKPHFEDRSVGGDVKALAAKYGTPDKFLGRQTTT